MSETPQVLGTKEGIFAAKRSYAYVEVPEWGGIFRIQSMTGDERDEFEASFADKKGRTTMKSFRAKLVGASLVSEDGSKLLSNSFEIAELGKSPVSGLQRIYNAATALNGMSDDDVASLTTDFKPDAAPVESSTSV